MGRHPAVVVGWSSPCPQAVVVAVEVVKNDREWLKQLAHFCTAGSSHALSEVLAWRTVNTWLKRRGDKRGLFGDCIAYDPPNKDGQGFKRTEASYYCRELEGFVSCRLH